MTTSKRKQLSNNLNLNTMSRKKKSPGTSTTVTGTKTGTRKTNLWALTTANMSTKKGNHLSESTPSMSSSEKKVSMSNSSSFITGNLLTSRSIKAWWLTKRANKKKAKDSLTKELSLRSLPSIRWSNSRVKRSRRTKKPTSWIIKKYNHLTRNSPKGTIISITKSWKSRTEKARTMSIKSRWNRLLKRVASLSMRKCQLIAERRHSSRNIRSWWNSKIKRANMRKKIENLLPINSHNRCLMNFNIFNKRTNLRKKDCNLLSSIILNNSSKKSTRN